MDALAWIAEQRIREAVERGELDNLPGSGRPMVLEDDSHVPPELRLAYKMLRNAGYVPPELEAQKEIRSIRELLAHCTDVQERVRQMRKLDVLLVRMEQGHRRPVFLTEDSPYYTKIVEHVEVQKPRS